MSVDGWLGRCGVLTSGKNLETGKKRIIRSAEGESNSMSMKKALITGVTGQDGSYLAEFLLEKG